MFDGKIIYKWAISIAMLNYQRVTGRLLCNWWLYVVNRSVPIHRTNKTPNPEAVRRPASTRLKPRSACDPSDRRWRGILTHDAGDISLLPGPFWDAGSFNHSSQAELRLPDSFNIESILWLIHSGLAEVRMPGHMSFFVITLKFQTSPGRIGRSNFLQLLGATGAAFFAGSRRCRAVLWRVLGSPGRLRSNMGISGTVRL